MEDMMWAGVFEGIRQFRVKQHPSPKITKPDDVIVKVEGCGICGSDINMVDDPNEGFAVPDCVLGHEFVARVAEVGPAAEGFREGDRVVVEPNVPCGQCAYCRMGAPTQCLDLWGLGYIADGAFAPYSKAPAKMLHKISEAVPMPVATLVEPLTCVMGGMEKLDVEPGCTVVVLGAGPIGILYMLMSKAMGAGKVIMSEPSAERRALALEMGADMAVDPLTQDLRSVVMAETTIGADIAIDAVGNLLAPGLDVVRRRGTVLLFGLHAGDATVTPSLIAWREFRVLGSFIESHVFPKAVKVLEAGLIDPQKLISRVMPLAEVVEAMDILRKQKAQKIVIDPWATT